MILSSQYINSKLKLINDEYLGIAWLTRCFCVIYTLNIIIYGITTPNYAKNYCVNCQIGVFDEKEGMADDGKTDPWATDIPGEKAGALSGCGQHRDCGCDHLFDAQLYAAPSGERSRPR